MSLTLAAAIVLAQPPVAEAPPASAAVAAAKAGDEAPAAAPPAADAESVASAIDGPLLDAIVLRLARDGNREGERLLEAEDLPGALTAFAESQALDPSEPTIATNLGVTYHRLGNAERAEHFLRLAADLDPANARARRELAGLLAEQGDDRLAEARDLLLRARELAGNQRDLLLAQARIEARLANLAGAERLYLELLAQGGAPDHALQLELGDVYRDLGRPEKAQAWYEGLAAAPDPAVAATARERLRRLEVEDEARRLGWTHRASEVSARARALRDQAAAFAVQGRTAEAEGSLDEALRLDPAFTEAAVALGDSYARRGQPAQAELAFLRALAFDHGSVEAHVRLGELYLATGRAAAAVLLLERAVLLTPASAELRLQLARGYRFAGDFPRALAAVETYLARAEPEHAWEAHLLRASLFAVLREQGARALGAGLAAAGAAATEAGEAESDALPALTNRVRVLLARGETDAAMVELRRAADRDRGPALRNLEARILVAAGRLPEAAAAFAASLAEDPDQAAVHTELGLVFESSGALDDARAHWRTAETLGDRDASFHLARAALADHRARSLARRPFDLGALFEASGRVERFLAASPASVHRAAAAALARELRAAWWASAAAGVGSGALALLLVALGLWRWRGGASLATLVAAHPETGPEVQRVLAAIRHEVLKHNTMALTGLAEALGRGEGAAEATAVIEALWRPGGVADKLRGYAGELVALGRAADVRLNLARRDPALAALHRGLALLRRARRPLGRVGRLSPRRRRRLVAQVRRAAAWLNAAGYDAVCAMIDELRVLRLDEPWLRALFARIAAEPALRSVTCAPLDFCATVALPAGVTIARAHLEDVLGNLLRNAVQASRAAGVEPVAIGLEISAEVDAITGHERVCLAVRDRSSQALSPEAIAQASPAGGLGLVAELVARYDGVLAVTGEIEGWTKAVVVKLPRAELGAGA